MKGHPFSQRLGLVKESDKGKHRHSVFYKEDHVLHTCESPVFILFLDCVHQLLQQFPSSFGFTEQFLLLLVDSIHMCLFETFLFNCELERKRFVYDSLVSLWDFIHTQVPTSKFQTLFLNRLYNVGKSFEAAETGPSPSSGLRFKDRNDLITYSCESSVSKPPRKSWRAKKKGRALLSVNAHYQSVNDPNVSVINPDSSSVHVQLWDNYFLRWTPTVDLSKGSSQDFSQQLQQIELLDELKYLEDRHEHLKVKLEELENRSTGDTDSPLCAIPTKQYSRKGLNRFTTDESFAELFSHFSFCKLIHPDK